MSSKIEDNKVNVIKELIYLRSKLDFDYIFQKKEFTQDDIKRYYKKTKYLLYRLAGSKDGYMHIGISDDGKEKKGTQHNLYQIEKLDEIIKHNNYTQILELGCGQGANMAYLSKRNKTASFKGIDLYPSLDKKNKKYDITIYEGDYHNLSKIEDNSIDLVYAIETMCYSLNKNQIFKEVNRVLKDGGLFIIFDAYLAKQRDKLSEIELVLANLVENGYYLDEFEYIGNLNKYINDNNFKIIREENMKDKVKNHLLNYQNRIKKYLKMGPLFKFVCKLVPREVFGNIVPIYFMYNTIDMNLSVYYYHILQKK